MIADKKTWDECAAECPGMNKGRVWPYEEIEANKKAYLDNVPLHREEVEALIAAEKESV